jgi:hypothetical protein
VRGIGGSKDEAFESNEKDRLPRLPRVTRNKNLGYGFAQATGEETKDFYYVPL